MSAKTLFILWPEYPALSVVLIIIVVITLLYFSRTYAHGIIRSLCRILHNAFRIASQSVLLAEKKLVIRNREVLLASGRESAEREIEREFHRIDQVVRRDLQGYPDLQRKLGELISRIDENYRETLETPPSPPSWLSAISTVAKIPSKGDPMVANMLGEINKSLAKHHRETMEEHRKGARERMQIMKKMMPNWRKLSRTLEEVGKTITGLFERSAVIDYRMQEYEEIFRGTDRAARMLSSSSMTQFFISGFVLLIAIGGAVINFNLIALPMSEMVGGGSYIGPFQTANVAALVIILVEAAMGIYLMEALRVTRLFPIIGTMDDRMRKQMALITFSILCILAGIEAALAFMRDLIASDMQALRQSLASTEAVQPVHRWIPMVGQMVMGFILPFALAFVAIPLESFIQSSRTVIGALAAAFLRSVSFALRLIGNIARYLGEGLVNLYDLLVFPHLWVERLIRERMESAQKAPKEEVLR